MKRVVIGLLGTNLDRGSSPERWDKWRPSVSLFQQEDLLIDRFELLADPAFCELADHVAEDIRHVSPETEVRIHELRFGRDPWDLADVYGAHISNVRSLWNYRESGNRLPHHHHHHAVV